MINKTFDEFSLTSQQPMYFAFRPTCLAMKALDFVDRQYAIVFVGAKNNDLGTYAGQAVRIKGVPYAIFPLSGRVSAYLLKSGVTDFYFYDVLNDGAEPISRGKVKILPGPPKAVDNDAAPFARYIDLVTYSNNPANDLPATVEVTKIYYDPLDITADGDGNTLPPVNTVLPTLSGDPEVGSTLTVSPGTWTNNPTSFAYRWYADDTLIVVATGNTYAPVAADIGKSIYVTVIAISGDVRAAANTLTSDKVTATPVLAPVNTVAPTISGTAKVGETLTVVNGTWSNSPTFTYQWKADGVAISGATASSLTLVTAHTGKAITITVTGTNTGGAASATSAPTAAVLTDLPQNPTNTAAPVINGIARQGETLTVTNGTWTNAPTSYTRQWRSNSAIITGATGTSYTVLAADIGKTISVTVVATNSFGTGTSTSAPVGPVTTIPANGLDSTIPTPTMMLSGGKGTFPPAFDVEIPVEAQADNIKFKIERYALTALNTVADTYAGTITDAMANASAVSGLFTSVTVPSSYRMRLETLDGQRWSAWSNTIVHGDTEAPVITTASLSIKEGVKLALPLTVSNEPAGVTWALTGADAAFFEIVGSTLRILADGVFDFEAPKDGDKNNVYGLTLTAADYSGNSASKDITLTILDADEIVDDYSFTGQTNATASTDYSRSMTVSGLEAGYSVPITVADGLRYAINGGTITTAAGQVKNGDVVTVTLKSSNKGATTVTGSLNIGGVVRSFTIQTAIGSTPAIASVSRFPTTYLEYTKEASLDFGVGTCFFYLLTNSAAKNFKLDGVAVTSMVPATEGFLFMFDNTTAGTKKLSFELSGFYNATGIGVTVANVSTATPSLTYTPNAYYNAPITIPATTVPTDGFGLVMVSSSRALTSTTYQSNLIVDRTVADTKTNGTEFMVGSLAGAGDAKYGSLGGYYTAVAIGLAKKI